MLFPTGIIEVSTPRKWRFLLYFIPYTITEFQPPETLSNIPRVGIVAMWKTFFSAPQNAKKKENQMKHKNQVRNRLLIDS